MKRWNLHVAQSNKLLLQMLPIKSYLFVMDFHKSITKSINKNISYFMYLFILLCLACIVSKEYCSISLSGAAFPELRTYLPIYMAFTTEVSESKWVTTAKGNCRETSLVTHQKLAPMTTIWHKLSSPLIKKAFKHILSCKLVVNFHCLHVTKCDTGTYHI